MIYFARTDVAIKIGYSSNPYNRLSALQVSNSSDITISLIITGGRIKEQELHRQFRDQRIKGEWFTLDSAIEEYIEENIHRDRRYEFGICYHDFEGDEQMVRLRKQHGLRGIDVAERLQISQQAVSRIENEEKIGSITLKTMQRFAKAMGYKFEYRFVV